MEDMMKIEDRADKSLLARIAQRKIIIPIKRWNVDYFFKIIDLLENKLVVALHNLSLFLHVLHCDPTMDLWKIRQFIEHIDHVKLPAVLAQNDEGLEDFFKYDRCYKYADKYLIAMVFMYFLRASYLPEEYTSFNFYVALYLAHDMEEDDEDTRAEILTWSPAGASGIWTPSLLLSEREQLFKRMDYRAVVSRTCCESIMDIARPKHPIWKRQRHPVHAGAIPRFHRIRNVCPNCIGKRSPEST